MWEKLRAFLNRHWEWISYLFFGGVTTVVNFLVFAPLYNLAHYSATVSNVIAWFVAVIVAYLTNKPFVFKSMDWSANVVIPEFLKFLSCRVVSGVLETLLLGLTVDILLWNGNWMKVIISILVVILNYVGSKLLVFGKRN